MVKSVPYVVTLAATIPSYPYASPNLLPTASATMSVSILDPCIRTVISSPSVVNLTSFAGYNSTSLVNYTISDSMETLAAITDYCGIKNLTFYLGSSTPTTLLNGTNRGQIVFKPVLVPSPTYGTTQASLVVSMNEFPLIKSTVTFYVTTLGYLPTYIPDQKY